MTMYVLQGRSPGQKRPFQRMVYVGLSAKKAREKANQLLLDDNSPLFVELVAFNDGVTVFHVCAVDELKATYVLSPVIPIP